VALSGFRVRSICHSATEPRLFVPVGVRYNRRTNPERSTRPYPSHSCRPFGTPALFVYFNPRAHAPGYNISSLRDFRYPQTGGVMAEAGVDCDDLSQRSCPERESFAATRARICAGDTREGASLVATTCCPFGTSGFGKLMVVMGVDSQDLSQRSCPERIFRGHPYLPALDLRMARGVGSKENGQHSLGANVAR